PPSSRRSPHHSKKEASSPSPRSQAPPEHKVLFVSYMISSPRRQNVCKRFQYSQQHISLPILLANLSGLGLLHPFQHHRGTVVIARQTEIQPMILQIRPARGIELLFELAVHRPDAINAFLIQSQ